MREERILVAKLEAAGRCMDDYAPVVLTCLVLAEEQDEGRSKLRLAGGTIGESMEFDRWFAALGTLASLLGVLLAFVQTVRLKALQRRTHTDTWLGIRLVRSILISLDRSAKYKEDTNVARAYASTADLFRHLLKEAVLAEREFTENTILRWKAAGKLEGVWQVSQARHFLETDRINVTGNANAEKS